MSFYGLGTKPLLDKLSEQVLQVRQVWLADDASGADRINELKLVGHYNIGRYYVNESKSWLILKDS